jgi:hypothetical protein
MNFDFCDQSSPPLAVVEDPAILFGKPGTVEALKKIKKFLDAELARHPTVILAVVDNKLSIKLEQTI